MPTNLTYHYLSDILLVIKYNVMKKLRPNRMTGKWFVCTICGKKYYKTKSQIKNCSGKYCSSECYWNYLKKHTPKHLIEINKKKYLLPIKCKLCGKLFKPVNAKQKYCCSICYHKATTTLKEIVCPNCGKLFKPTVFTQTYCSKECANKRERKNWNSWKKGKPLSKENASNIQKALIEHYDRVGRKSRRKKHSL